MGRITRIESKDIAIGGNIIASANYLTVDNKNMSKVFFRNLPDFDCRNLLNSETALHGVVRLNDSQQKIEEYLVVTLNRRMYKLKVEDAYKEVFKASYNLWYGLHNLADEYYRACLCEDIINRVKRGEIITARVSGAISSEDNNYGCSYRVKDVIGVVASIPTKEIDRSVIEAINMFNIANTVSDRSGKIGKYNRVTNMDYGSKYIKVRIYSDGLADKLVKSKLDNDDYYFEKQFLNGLTLNLRRRYAKDFDSNTITIKSNIRFDFESKLLAESGPRDKEKFIKYVKGEDGSRPYIISDTGHIVLGEKCDSSDLSRVDFNPFSQDMIFYKYRSKELTKKILNQYIKKEKPKLDVLIKLVNRMEECNDIILLVGKQV